MRLSSAYLYEQLNKRYLIKGSGGISGRDGYLRPFLCSQPEEPGTARGGASSAARGQQEQVEAVSTARGGSQRRVGDSGTAPEGRQEQVEAVSAAQGGSQNRIGAFGHVCVYRAESVRGLPALLRRAEEERQFLIFCGCGTCDLAAELAGVAAGTPWLCIDTGEAVSDVVNGIQEIFDICDDWDGRISALMLENAGIGRIVEEGAAFLGNPLMVMGMDFSLVAETGSDKLPARARLFTADGVNMDYMNALLQDEGFQKLAASRETQLFPPYISGCRSWNRNLYVEGQPTYRLVLTECTRPITPGDVCLLEAMTGRLEYLLAHERLTPMADDMEQIFLRILTDRTADYIQVSRRLGALGWSAGHDYLCLILQITYLNQKQLSTKAICRYIKRQLPHSISIVYQEEVVTFFDLTKLGMDEEAVAAKLVYFIRDSYLKAGYSRTMRGHMNLRRQYVQARTALDVGARRRPYLWIHHFSQVALTYMMEQATRRLPGSMLCHEGLLRLREADERNHTEYLETLKTYLDQHLNATQTAKLLFIHRSTFLYRLDRIKELLQSDLENPDEIFYLELSIRLLEQEEEGIKER